LGQLFDFGFDVVDDSLAGVDDSGKQDVIFSRLRSILIGMKARGFSENQHVSVWETARMK